MSARLPTFFSTLLIPNSRIIVIMLKDTKSLGNSKASACESRGFVHKKEGALFDTPSFFFICVNKGSVRFSDFWMKVLLIFLFVYTDGIGIGCIEVMCDAIQ